MRIRFSFTFVLLTVAARHFSSFFFFVNFTKIIWVPSAFLESYGPRFLGFLRHVCSGFLGFLGFRFLGSKHHGFGYSFFLIYWLRFWSDDFLSLMSFWRPDEGDLSFVTIFSCFNYFLLYKIVSCLLAASCLDSHFYLHIVSPVILKVEINQISPWRRYGFGFLRAWMNASGTLRHSWFNTSMID